MNIHNEGARFTVVCKRCDEKFAVIRNWGGGIRREYQSKYKTGSNPAQCDCGSRQLEVF